MTEFSFQGTGLQDIGNPLKYTAGSAEQSILAILFCRLATIWWYVGAILPPLMSNILWFVKNLTSAESQTKAPFALRNAKILLTQKLDLQLKFTNPVEQWDLMRSQVQSSIKNSECGLSAKWTITIDCYQTIVCSTVATPLAIQPRLKGQNFSYKAFKYFSFTFLYVLQLLLLPISHRSKTKGRPEGTRAHHASI